jgi:indole-3-glycerol phosphate synthase/phosphoribosylanthranilate isomerase
MTIIDEIVERRKRRVGRLGHGMGAAVPQRRRVPLIEFGKRPLLICEVKRRSPSKGVIAPDVDIIKQAETYREKGVGSVSVLTEEEFFSGSMNDLMRIKSACPDMAVLRKDFLIDEEDLEVSYRAGADAVLLIASMHDERDIFRLYRRARRLGMAVLMEVHDNRDLQKIESVRPRFTGFNSRDLQTFGIDPIRPVRLMGGLTWDTVTVYESGIKTEEDGLFALSSGFTGLLVGEAVMRNTEIIPRLQKIFRKRKTDFWRRLYARKTGTRPLVKICGITRREDAQYAAEMGADLLGFVFARSQRRAGPALLRELRELDVLKVGVVVGKENDLKLDPEAGVLLKEGYLDAIQFHGDERAGDCSRIAYPYYKAVRISGPRDVEKIASYRCPRVLADAFVEGRQGGTGERIAAGLVRRVKDRFVLWLAGGIGPSNVRDVTREYEPELIDASSLLEEEPGIKSRDKIAHFFKEIESGKDL